MHGELISGHPGRQLVKWKLMQKFLELRRRRKRADEKGKGESCAGHPGWETQMPGVLKLSPRHGWASLTGLSPSSVCSSYLALPCD